MSVSKMVLVEKREGNGEQNIKQSVTSPSFVQKTGGMNMDRIATARMERIPYNISSFDQHLCCFYPV